MGAINNRQYEWNDLQLVLGTRDITEFQGIKYSEKIELEPVYGKGRNPHSIQSGNVSFEGEITLLQSELETLIAAGNGSIFNLNLSATVSYGNPANGDAMITDRITGLRFSESGKELKQGDKNMLITLPFIATGIQYQVA